MADKCPKCGAEDLTAAEQEAGLCYDCQRSERETENLRHQLAAVQAENARLIRDALRARIADIDAEWKRHRMSTALCDTNLGHYIHQAVEAAKEPKP